MGKNMSKEEIVVAQNGTNANLQDSTWHNYFSRFILGILVMGTIVYCRVCRRCTLQAKKWLNRHMQIIHAQTIETMQSARGSMRKSRPETSTAKATTKIDII